MALTPLSRRKLVLGTGGVLTYGALAWWSVEYRIRRAEVPLYSETVAFSAPGVRELVPTGHPDAVVPGTRVLAARPLSTMLVEDEQAWLEGCAPWVRTALDGGDDVLRSALLDLRALSVGLPVCVAGWSEKWRYAWPRDVSFVATALARTGHPEHAAEQLAFLQEVQRHDGWFEARYDLRTLRTPDDRVAQLDGSAWSVWGAHQLALAAPDRAVELLTPLRPMFLLSTQRLLASLDADTLLPMASSDYWELVERSVTLGTAASVLAGLRSATEVLPLVGGATGMIGDPSGKENERQLLGAEEVRRNVEGIRENLSRFPNSPASKNQKCSTNPKRNFPAACRSAPNDASISPP